MFRHAAQLLGIYPMGIVESPVVFGCGHNRHIQHRINAATADELSPGRPATCPAPRVVVYLVLALCLFTADGYDEVVRKLTNGLRGPSDLAG